MANFLKLPGNLLGFLIGHFTWSAPPWLAYLYNQKNSHPKLFWGAVIFLLSVFGAYLYYQSLPKPVFIQAIMTKPDLTANVENPTPDSLKVKFNYDLNDLRPDQIRPKGEPSVAKIDLVGKKLVEGVQIEPAIVGEWKWIDDRRLEFSPEKDWPPGTRYDVVFDERIFVQEAKFKTLSYAFTTHPFSIDMGKLEFYQDPQDISIRRVIGTLSFSHPVNKKILENRLAFLMRPSGAEVDSNAKRYKFAVTYDQNQREAYVRSEPIALPQQTNYMKLILNKGIKSVLGGEALENELTEQILIPDIYNFLKVGTAKTEVLPNAAQQPEQLLMLTFSDDIPEKEILDKLKVYLLPERNEKRKSKYWRGPREVTETVLRNAQPIDLKLIPNERSFSKAYNFVFDVPEGRYIYAYIQPGLESVNKFVKRSLYDNVFRVPAYPKKVKIMGEGSVLTSSGNHRLSLLARGIDSLKVIVGKVLPDQVHHLVSQTGGDIKDPHFSSHRFSEMNISEYREEIIDLKLVHPKTANYSSIDLSAYLPEKANLGLFFVEVKGWDKKQKREIYGSSDKRLIMVTDLGMLVKNNADRSHDVFVQSLQSGKPVTNARVELLGKNGIALFERTTASDGHVRFPSTKDFVDEKKPNVYVIKTHNDLSFIPFDRHSRQINYSKFEVGGIRPQKLGGDNLTGYVFSDRGIYRPGETVNVGFIVKKEDLGNIAGIPLELVIRGPRNNETKVYKLTLPEKGLFDFKYATENTSETGAYKIDLHLVRDNRRRGRIIGSGNFKVEEFQPDTLKIESRLVGAAKKGWTSLKNVQAKVELQNLFGTPAQNRKVVGNISVRPTSFKFTAFNEYTFIDPFGDNVEKPLALDETLTATKTNANGLAEFDISLERFVRGTYTFEFVAEGFDAGGGRSVFAHNRMMLSPLPYLVGYKSDGKLDYIKVDTERSVDLIAINSNLDKQEKIGLTTKLIEIQHISTLIKQKNGTYKYQVVNKEREVSIGLLDIENNGTKYRLPTSKPGDFALEIYDPADIKLSRIVFSVVGHVNLVGKLEKKAELQLKLNKADYKAGEDIEMNIRAPYVGAGLITIETDKVHNHKWFRTTTESTIESIRVPDNLEGNAYVNVSFLRSVHSKEIFTSPLSYAVAPFTIDQSQRKIDVSLDINALVHPGKELVIKYKASKPSKIVVFAVDEGILQVAQYKTPEPLGYFLRKRSLAVTTLQLLDLVLPDFNWTTQSSASGGGKGRMKAIAKNLNPFSRKTDKPAVFWSGVVEGGREEKTVSFTVPDTFSGTMRVMAVAVGEDGMGVSTRSVLVRGPFVISPNVLTQAAPGDEFIVTVGIANLVENSGENAPVTVTMQPSDHFEILATNKMELKISEGDEGEAGFRVRVKNQLGSAELKFRVKLADVEGNRTVGLSVRPAMPYYSSFESGYEKNGSVELSVQRLLYADLAQQNIAASTGPLVLIDGLSSYLENFPHGCTEQVVSKVFPLIGLMSHPGFEPGSEKTRDKFNYLIDKLRERQLGAGGFSFWPGGRSVSKFPSVYVMHFLIDSQDLGYPVPADMIQRGKDFLSQYVGQSATNLQEARIKAHATYLLTRLGQVTTNYLVNLQEYLDQDFKPTWKDDLTAVYIAATYQLLQKKSTADALVDQYVLGSRDGDILGDFDSPLTQDAQYIYLLSKHFKDRAMALDGNDVLTLINPIFKGEYNTISSAYSILALGAYSKLKLKDDPDEHIVFSMKDDNGKMSRLDTVQKPFLKALYPIAARHLYLEADKSIFYLNVQSGFDQILSQTAVRKGLEISKDFIDGEGNQLDDFEQGKEVTVRLRIRALKEPVTNVAVVDLLPGGFEVVRSSVPRIAHNWRADYVDVREDRVVFYGAFDTSLKEIEYKVKLIAAGNFRVPPAFAEAMYDRSIKARSVPARFEVTPAN